MFKSNAQKAKFRELLKEGKISQETFDEYDKATKGHLPERVAAVQKKPKTLLRKKHYAV